MVLMKGIRESIQNDMLLDFRREFFTNYSLEGRTF
jgi:queuine/archaeosine tRNA-ribosyltransferase